MTKVGETLRVGLTGGIASGKTLVAAILEVCGAPVAFADTMARGLMEAPGPVKDQLTELLGPEAYRETGELDRQALGLRLFNDPELLDQVNGIVHPAVGEAALAWHQQQAVTSAYTVYESALLFEANSASQFDLVVIVHAPQVQRIARAVARGGVDEAAVEARMAAQLSDADRLDQKGYVILNDGSAALIPQVYALHRLLTERGRA